MKNKLIKNLNTHKKIVDLTDSVHGTFGKCVTTYEVHRRRDVTNLDNAIGYTILMNQRLIMQPKNSYKLGPNTTKSYEDYPAIFQNALSLEIGADEPQVTLSDIFPRTINTAVSTSSNDSQGSSSSNTHESTRGSSLTNINTFAVGLNAGYQAGPMGGASVGISADYSHSWEESKSKSTSEASTNANETNLSHGASMSIKDWSAYSFLDKDAYNPTWVWAQAYPWDVIQYSYSSGGNSIDLPDFIKDRMLTDGLLVTPIDLSLFGLDFSMQASWSIDFKEGITEDETLVVSNKITQYTATHELKDDNSLSVKLDDDGLVSKFNTDTLDLSLYALNPLHTTSGSTGAYIGFEANPFTYAPTDESDTFKIVSPANNLQVKGQGFNPDISTDLAKDTRITINFKVVDVTIDYGLILMHWIGKNSGAVNLNWAVNDQWTGTVMVDDQKGEGADNNLSHLDLRNTDFTSINFHDYLQLGMNTVTVEFEAVDSKADIDYTLFAIGLDTSGS